MGGLRTCQKYIGYLDFSLFSNSVIFAMAQSNFSELNNCICRIIWLWASEIDVTLISQETLVRCEMLLFCP